MLKYIAGIAGKKIEAVLSEQSWVLCMCFLGSADFADWSSYDIFGALSVNKQ